MYSIIIAGYIFLIYENIDAKFTGHVNYRNAPVLWSYVR